MSSGMESVKEYPESDAVMSWESGGLRFSIVRAMLGGLRRRKHFCGYVRFPKRPVGEAGYDGILAYVPVHGGITYAAPGKDGSMVYGFDCGHPDDEQDARCRDMDWLMRQCSFMATGIQEAAKWEGRYLAASDTAAQDDIVSKCEQAMRKKKEGRDERREGKASHSG